MNEQRGCHQDYLQKKEAKGKWSEYWVILNGNYLLFYESKKSSELFGSIEIGSNTKCVVTKKKGYSFPFMVCAIHGRHLFKCESAVQRHRWMTAIHDAAKLLNSSPSSTIFYTDLPADDLVEAEVNHLNDDGHDDVLPPNVVLVASFPTLSDSPSHPFRIRDRKVPSEVNAPAKEISKKPVVVYPFTWKSEESCRANSSSEREQFNMLNFRPTSLRGADSVWPADCSISPRHRSFPNTPEKGTRPSSTSPRDLGESFLAKSKSLNSIPSSDRLLATNMLFSRHMNSGNDGADMEV